MKYLASALAALGCLSLIGCSGSDQSSTGSILPVANAQSQVPAPVALPDVKEMEALVMQTAATGHLGGGLSVASSAATAAVTKGAPAPKATLNGWNLYYPDRCLGANIVGSSFIYVYFKDGTVAWANDPAMIALLSAACSSPKPIGLFITQQSGGIFIWQYAVVFSG